MKEYYLIKCRNNIPFIIGQYDTEEDSGAAEEYTGWRSDGQRGGYC